MGVGAVLAMTPLPDELEVYIGWASQPVSVALRRDSFPAVSWDRAAPLLQARVLDALAPLRDKGWYLNGTFSVATRWDMSHGPGGDLYEGCWVRLRR